jgi:tight adherence protein C
VLASSWLDRRCGRAGRRADPAATAFDERLGAALLIGSAVALVQPVLALAAATAVWGAPALRARRRARARQQKVVRELPLVVELLRLAVGAGSSVHHAVEAVAPRAPGLCGAALTRVLTRQAAGERLADAFDALGSLGEPARPLTAALVAAERYGTPLLPALDLAAVDARSARRRSAEESARRLPVRLLFPLVGCILPAFTLLTVAPVLAASLPHLAA